MCAKRRHGGIESEFFYVEIMQIEIPDYEPLRLGLAQARTQAAIKKNAAEVQPNESVEESTYARSKFASQKSISSDQYFQRGGYDPNLSSETQARLSQFQGQSSISSNQYFGREEEEEDDYAPSGHNDFSDLESSAKAYYRRFMENPDVQQGIEVFRAGALKVRSFTDSSLNISKTSAATARSQVFQFALSPRRRILTRFLHVDVWHTLPRHHLWRIPLPRRWVHCRWYPSRNGCGFAGHTAAALASSSWPE
jgi:hypothetical protein